MFRKGLFSLAGLALLAMTTACGGGVKSSEPTELIEFRQVLAVATASTSQVEILGETYTDISCENPPKPVSENVDLIACDRDGLSIYFLGPIELDGNAVDSSEQSLSDEVWMVSIAFTEEGSKVFANITGRISSMVAPMNQIAITQGTLVITSPTINEPITAGLAQITGNFTKEEAEALASAIQNKRALPEFFRRL